MSFGENRILQRQAYETSDYQFAAENLAYSYGEIEVFSNVSVQGAKENWLSCRGKRFRKINLASMSCGLGAPYKRPGSF